ncbi:MAG: CYTH domain-containing protein [Candidatus Cryptobacteroides sp.]|nr:CYTH domain-containing protein [Candidatus Cryptobacteroides sp.]
MNHIEIERKFLVKSPEFKDQATGCSHFVQGYITSPPAKTVRVRIADDKAYLTIKGSGSASGMSRFEWEMEIPGKDALALLGICEGGVIEKDRYYVPYAGHTFEVDEFFGDNEGLVMAEVELSSEDESFEKPEWLGQEVTGDSRYYNSSLRKHPYIQWKR